MIATKHVFINVFIYIFFAWKCEFALGGVCVLLNPSTKRTSGKQIEEITKSRKYARKTQKSSNRSFFSFQSIKGFFAPWEILILLEA